MIDGRTFGLIELIGSAAVVFAFCFWQLYQLRKLRKERERKQGKDEPN